MWTSTCPLPQVTFWPLTSGSLTEFIRRLNTCFVLIISVHVHYPKGAWCSFLRVETDQGDYMFCFDNTFSTVSEKIIFFELILDNMDDGEDPETWKEYVQGADLLDMKLEDIMVREHTHVGTLASRIAIIQNSSFLNVKRILFAQAGCAKLKTAKEVRLLHRHQDTSKSQVLMGNGGSEVCAKYVAKIYY